MEQTTRAEARPYLDAGDPKLSPRTLSRIAGALYLLIIALGTFGEAFVRARIVAPEDAAATAANLRALESVWRVGVAAEMVLLMCAVALTLILYVLLRPVSRELALLAAFFHLVTIAVEGAAAIFLTATLFPVGGAAYLGAFQPEQLAALTSLSIRSHGHGFGLALVFFGGFCLVAGHLIYRSRYMPRALGLLLVLAGGCYLVNSFALILSPAVSARLFPAILIPAFVAELSLALWLLVKGISPERWAGRTVGALAAPAAAIAGGSRGGRGAGRGWGEHSLGQITSAPLGGTRADNARQRFRISERKRDDS